MFAIKTWSLIPDLRQAGLDAAQKLKVHLQPLQPFLEEVDVRLDALERQWLDPLLDRALTLWGDRRSEQQRALHTPSPVSALSVDERQINRGLYITASSLSVAVVGTLVFPPLRLVSLPGLFYGSWHVYKAAYASLIEKRTIDNNVLMALVNTAYIGGGFLVLGNVSVMAHFGSAKLFSVVKDRFEQDLRLVLRQQPITVWVLLGNQEVPGQLDELRAGDIVVVRAGEVIPVDGVVIDGVATVDQHVLTGEARPIEKAGGDRAFAATVILTGKLHVQLEQAGSETTVARIGEILAQTVDFRSTRQLQVQQLTDRLVLPVLGLATLTYPFLGISSATAVVNAHPYRQLNTFGSLSLLNYLVLATEQEILVKDGRSLELLRQVDTLVLDKTGTLTQEQPQLSAIHLCANLSEDQLLAYAAAAEQRQSHPIARAILAAANQRRLPLPAVDQASFQVGFGLEVQVQGHTLQIGSARFITQFGITIPPTLAPIQAACQAHGHSLVFVALDGQLAGAVELQAALRPEAKAVLAELRQRARLRQVIIVSGDQEAPTRHLAQELGADAYYAEVLPAGKAELVAQLQAQGRTVCFIGDGINDAIALKQAQVSISLRGATSAATDTAHIVLMDESLAKLPRLFGLVDQFDATQRNTLLAVLGTSAVSLVGIFTLGWGLTAATILDQVSLALGTAVVMRPWQQRRRQNYLST
jgi:Cu2+-exporting ATPase